jgi:2,3-bisphosphoglycerate-dependent phosphoglycerate mutase
LASASAKYAGEVPDLILLRHGQSAWNDLNLFTGWTDVDLTAKGEDEALVAGQLLAAEADLDLRVLHTSVLTRAIRTAEIALHAAGRSWLPVRRNWRLNERHYGDLTGKDKKETADQFGLDQVKLWRRSYDVPPPPLPDGDPRSSLGDPRYRDVPAEFIPATECLKDVVARVTPYFADTIVEDLRSEAVRGGAVIVVAHGNSIRALRMVLQNIPEDEIAVLEIPTGIPYRITLDDGLNILNADYLGDPAAAAAAAEAVARQAGWLQGCGTSFVGADSHHVLDVRDPGDAVTHRVGACGLHDRVDERFDQFIRADNLHADLVHEVELVLFASVDLNVTAGVAESSSLRNGHAGDADLLDGGLHLVKFERLDDCGDELHCLSLDVVGVKVAG